MSFWRSVSNLIVVIVSLLISTHLSAADRPPFWCFNKWILPACPRWAVWISHSIILITIQFNCKYVLSGHTKAINSIKFSSDGCKLLSGGKSISVSTLSIYHLLQRTMLFSSSGISWMARKSRKSPSRSMDPSRPWFGHPPLKPTLQTRSHFAQLTVHYSLTGGSGYIAKASIKPLSMSPTTITRSQPPPMTGQLMIWHSTPPSTSLLLLGAAVWRFGN